MKKLAFAVTAASGAAAVLSHHDAEASTQHKVCLLYTSDAADE